MLGIIIALLAFLGGAFSIIWGWRIWRQPNKLKPESLMHRVLLADWQTGPRSGASKAQGLTEKRVKYYAVRAIIGGIFGLLTAAILILELL